MEVFVISSNNSNIAALTGYSNDRTKIFRNEDDRYEFFERLNKVFLKSLNKNF